MRENPTQKSSRVFERGVLFCKTEFDVMKKNGDWLLIRLDDGINGWVRYKNKSKIMVKRKTQNVDFKPIYSDTFLYKTENDADNWAKGAKLIFLIGSDGALDGRCHKWVCFYISKKKPGKKLFCVYQYGEYKFEEWKINWRMRKTENFDITNLDDETNWWQYYYDLKVNGNFVSTWDLCVDKNIYPIKDYDAGIKEDDFTELALYSPNFTFIINKDEWMIVINDENSNPKHFFIYNSRTGRFIKYRKSVTEIIQACKERDRVYVKKLLRFKTDLDTYFIHQNKKGIESVSPIENSAGKDGDMEILKMLINAGYKKGLNNAMHSTDQEKINMLIKAGADVNYRFKYQKNSYTAIVLAIFVENYNLVKYLINMGADINLNDIEISFENKYYYGSIIGLAEKIGNRKIIDLLIKNGAGDVVE